MLAAEHTTEKEVVVEKKTSHKTRAILTVFSVLIAIPVWYFVIYAPAYIFWLNTFVESENALMLNILLSFPGDKDRSSAIPLAELPGVSPLGNAIERGNPAIVHLLIDKGADVNNRRDYPCLPLGAACASDTKNRYEIVRILVESGADVNAQFSEKSPSTPLILTFAHDYWYDFSPSDEMLSEKIKARLREDDRAINYLVMRYLIEHGAKLALPETRKEILSYAVCDGNIPAIEYLLKTGLFDANGSSESPGWPLIQAAQSDNMEVAKYLLVHGANPLVVDRDGDTVLGYLRDLIAGNEEYYEHLKPFVELYEEHVRKAKTHTTYVLGTVITVDNVPFFVAFF